MLKSLHRIKKYITLAKEFNKLKQLTMKKIKLFLIAIKRLRTTFSRYVVFRIVLNYIFKYRELPQAKITNPEMEEKYLI